VKPRPLCLASASPRRRELLTALDRPFTVTPRHVDESALPGEAPTAYALRLAEAKARATLLGAEPDGTDHRVVVGADTIVILDGEVLGKPRDDEEARRFLRRLRGRAHDVVTAVAVVDAATGRMATGFERTRVWMRAYGDDEMEAYVRTGDPLDKAGAYAVQSADFRPVARLRGSRSNVIGLPMGLLARLLRQVEGPAGAAGAQD